MPAARRRGDEKRRLVRVGAGGRARAGDVLRRRVRQKSRLRGRMAVLGLMGLFVAGLGVAGLYPLLLALALAAAGNQTVQASARATLASGTAILILPLTLGRLADAVGIQQAYGIVIVLLVALLGLMLITRRLN